MNKLSKSETAALFNEMARKYGVLDHTKSGGGHDRTYLGKTGNNKALFLACSRVNWMCVYLDATEKVLLVNNGFGCEPISSGDEPYEYRCHVNVSDFDLFLSIVKKYMGR